jgi:hypothetical protein
MNTNGPRDDATIPADLMQVSDALEALARADRAAAPEGFDERVLAAVRTGGPAAEDRPVVGRIGPSAWAGMRLAAVLGLVAGAALLGAVSLLGSRGVPSTSGTVAVTTDASNNDADAAALEAELSEFLAAATTSDDDELLTSGDATSLRDSFWDVGADLSLEESL